MIKYYLLLLFICNIYYSIAQKKHIIINNIPRLDIVDSSLFPILDSAIYYKRIHFHDFPNQTIYALLTHFSNDRYSVEIFNVSTSDNIPIDIGGFIYKDILFVIEDRKFVDKDVLYQNILIKSDSVFCFSGYHNYYNPNNIFLFFTYDNNKKLFIYDRILPD